MKDAKLKRRTVTITGLFAIDDDGIPTAPHRWSSLGGLCLQDFMKAPDYTLEVEDAPRELPTEKGALIRATVHWDGVNHAGQLLECADASLWRGLGGILDGGWYRSAYIGDDWVELVAKES